MNGHRESATHSVPALFIFLILGIFAVFSLVLVLFGAKAYRNTVDRTSDHNTRRILSSFVRNNLRTADVQDGITYIDDEIPRLMILDPEDDEYVKYIYVYDGRLCELYTETEKEFSPEAGEDICAAESLSVNREGNLLNVCISAEGTDHVTVFALRCEEDRT